MLSGGLLVAISGVKQQGAVRILIEHRALLADVSESWGRLVVTLPVCRRLAFRSEMPGEHEPLETVLATRHATLCGARAVKGKVELHFRMGPSHGLLEIEASDFEITLGGGRVLSFSEFSREIASESGRVRLDAV